MNQQEFIHSLHRELEQLPHNERKEIIADYKQHFLVYLRQGKSEEEIASLLGTPKSIAKLYKAEYRVKQAELESSAHNILHAVGAVLSLGLFNLLMVLGPFLGMVGALMALFCAGAAVSLTGVILFAGSLVSIFIPGAVDLPAALSSNTLTLAATLSMSVGFAAMGLLFIIGDYYLGRIFYRGTLRYLRFHIRLSRKEDPHA